MVHCNMVLVIKLVIVRPHFAILNYFCYNISIHFTLVVTQKLAWVPTIVLFYKEVVLYNQTNLLSDLDECHKK